MLENVPEESDDENQKSLENEKEETKHLQRSEINGHILAKRA